MKKFLSIFLLVALVAAMLFVPIVPVKAKAADAGLDETVLEAMYPAKDYYHETLWIGQVLMKTIEPSPRDYIDVQAAPVIIAARTYLPMRFVVENLMSASMAKTAVTWDAKARKATFVRGSHKVEVWIGKSAILVNGVSIVLDAPAFITKGRTMMPLRAISEGLGALVNWMATDIKGLPVNRIDIFASRIIN